MIALIALLAAATPAAGTAPPPTAAPARSAPDPAALAAARRVIVASDVRNQLRALMPRIFDAAVVQAHAMFKANAIPDGLETQLREVMRREVLSMSDIYTPDVLDRMADAYARHLTAADLNHVADILADPAMARFRDQQPAVVAEVMPLLMAAMAPRQAAFQKAIVQTVVDWMRAHPDDKARLAKPLAT